MSGTSVARRHTWSESGLSDVTLRRYCVPSSCATVASMKVTKVWGGTGRRACENKVLIARKRLEDKFVAALNEKVLDPELLDQVYERTATKVKELFAHVPEELRLKKIELNRAETRVHNFIEFIASGRATPTLADALSQAEDQLKSLSADIQSMEAAKDHAFTPPLRACIHARIGKLNHLLATRTEKSALALRRLTGAITLSPQKPEVGRLYYMARCKFDALNLLVEDGGSNLLHWWRRRPRRRREMKSIPG
jgi:hypothetical protein